MDLKTDYILGKPLEFIDESHTYIYDGIVLPSITQMLEVKFGNKYQSVDKRTLDEARDKGIEVHKAIEDYETKGIDNPDLVELRNYKFLKKSFGFCVKENEIPVVLFYNEQPISAGRIDLVLSENGKLGICDIKRTSTFDKEYVTLQTNLYRLAFMSSYGKQIDFLKGLHLREDTRRYIDIKIKEDETNKFIKDYLGGKIDE